MRLDLGLSSAVNNHWQGNGANFVVVTNSGHIYIFFVDGVTDPSYMKSTDGGRSWSVPVVIYTGTAIAIAVWYDRWSGLSSDLVSIAYTETDAHDTRWRTLDTATDTLGTEAVVHAGTSAVAASGALAVCRSRGGNVYFKTMIDAGAEGGFYKCLNANVGGSNAVEAALTNSEALATTDHWILMPGFAADNNDMMLFFWDASTNEIDRVLYDDSANTWALTNIATGMTEPGSSTAVMNMAAAPDLTNSRNLFCAWTIADTANADLRFWHVTESAITEVTNVVLNSGGEQALCGIQIDTLTEDWYVSYAGKSDGSETFPTDNLYCKKSTDDGATWGAETQLSLAVRARRHLMSCPRYPGPFGPVSTAASFGGQPFVTLNHDVPAALGYATMSGGLQ